MKVYVDEPYYLDKINKNAMYNNQLLRSIDVGILDNSIKVEKLSPNHHSKSVVRFDINENDKIMI